MKKGFSKKTNLALVLVLLSVFSLSSQAEAFNPFKAKPAPSTEADKILNPNINQAVVNEQNAINVIKDPVNVIKVLTDKEISQQKLLEAVNKKMGKAKNIPVENSRYIGIINGKRVYQDNDTLEYIKIEMDK